MSGPKIKPSMDAPKESGRQRGVVKDARDLLTQHYTTQAAARQPGTQQDGEGANEYATGKLEGMERDAAHTVGQTANRAVNEYKERTKAAKEKRQAAGEEKPDVTVEQGAQREAGRPAHRSSKDAADNPSNPGVAQAKQKLQGERAAEQRANSPYHGSGTQQAGGAAANLTGESGAGSSGDTGAVRLKTKEKAVKDGGKGAKQKNRRFQSRADRVKTAGKMKTAAKGKAQAAAGQQMKQRAQQIAKKATAAAKKTGELIAKAAAALGRAIVSIAAACGPLVVIIVAIAVVGAIIASPFGLFFNGEDADGTAAIQKAVSDISAEYRENLLHIMADNHHNELRLTYTNRGYNRPDNWIDVLAVYAVQTANPDDGMEVVTLDPERIEKLRAVFWDMQDVTHEVKNEPKYDADTDTYTDHYVLYIRATCKGAWEMADAYGFDRQQRDILEEMLNGAYDSYFATMIGNAGLFTAIGDGTPVVGNGNFIWPSDASTYVRSPYGSRPGVGVGDFHYGIDIAAGENTNVLASDGGSVISNSVDSSYGNHLLIDHGNGTQTLYGHMNAVFFGVGDSVEQGQIIGLCGNTGVSYGAHIHFEIRIGGSHVDPLQFFSNYTTAW